MKLGPDLGTSFMDLLTLALAGVVILYAITPPGESQAALPHFIEGAVTQVSETKVNHLCFVLVEPLEDARIPAGDARAWMNVAAEGCLGLGSRGFTLLESGRTQPWIWPGVVDAKELRATSRRSSA